MDRRPAIAVEPGQLCVIADGKRGSVAAVIMSLKIGGSQQKRNLR